MTAYLLQLTLDGEALAPRTIEGDTTPDLAQAVHRHARGHLGSRVVTIQIAPDGLTGTVLRGRTEVGVFALRLVADTQSAEPTSEDGLRGGWTLTTLDRLARSVVSNNRAWWPAGDRDDLYAAAWHGIVERLYSTADVPTRNDLMEAGRRALAADVKDSLRHHGARRDGTNTGQRHTMYWEWQCRTTPSPENGIVDRLALEQIMPTLTAGQRQALEALAATGDYRAAERLLGLGSGLRSQLMKGRRRFRELWHEGETPSKPWGCDRRAGSRAGEIATGESAVNRLRRRKRDQAEAAEARTVGEAA